MADLLRWAGSVLDKVDGAAAESLEVFKERPDDDSYVSDAEGEEEREELTPTQAPIQDVHLTSIASDILTPSPSLSPASSITPVTGTATANAAVVSTTNPPSPSASTTSSTSSTRLVNDNKLSTGGDSAGQTVSDIQKDNTR